jgi:hypothetical protein
MACCQPRRLVQVDGTPIPIDRLPKEANLLISNPSHACPECGKGMREIGNKKVAGRDYVTLRCECGAQKGIFQ